MDYTIPVSKEIHGDAIPLRHVAEAMARKAATGFGKSTLHPATLETVRPQYETDLLKAARNGTLKVCDIRGNSGTVEKLISTTEGLPQDSEVDTKALLALHIKAAHLAEWGKARGDTFTIVDVPVSVIEFGPDRGDGTKEYRGYVCDAFDLFGEHGYFDIPPSGSTPRCGSRRGGRHKGKQGDLLLEIIYALEAWAKDNNETFNAANMPGQVGDAETVGSFHWLCAKLYPTEFLKGKKAFKGYRAGRCTFPPYPKKSDFYSRALPCIAQTLGCLPHASATKQKTLKAS